ncbi:GerMN domain-containing protein [Paenibacillus sp. P96]|uniref:GerMN domain-containing protein n=1 Tax=Paenibacillus zeirhizosphaerae TaxID=2987519 RepID=A0ABT9FLW3_9BACL|nr:GerMN domain-containing protein [Paenibacillus sp. P96]MDP4095700.1 GerMN domain-containing protein [Paenibacillus sp. P96]
MRGKPSWRTGSAACILSSVLLLTACGDWSTGAESIDPPPAAVEEAMLAAVEPGGKEAVAAGTKLEAVYLQDANGFLVPVSLPVPGDTAEVNAKAALEMLVSGGPYAGTLPDGFEGVLPQGTEVQSVTLDKNEKLAVVEFTKPFTEYAETDERKMVEAVTWTLTEQPDIQNVQIWVDGQNLSEMPKGGLPLNRPLTRAMGLNLQMGQGASYTSSSPVTVYFSAASSAGVQYYVPITRLVPPGQDKMKASLEELIRGPRPEDGLNQVMTSGTVLKSVEQSAEGVVTVSITDDMFAAGEVVPAEFLQSVVLTASDNANNASAKVQIVLNGETTVLGEDNKNYGKPAGKPLHINEIPI